MAKGKQSSTNALRRQWALVRKIPRYPAKKTTALFARELADEGFSVAKRTVERDLVEIAGVFPTIECDERERPFGWSWAKDAVALHLPGMTASEALAFQMIERFVKELLPASTVDSLQPYLRASSEKLSELTGKSPASSWARKVRVVHPTQLLIPPKINPAVHRAVTESLLLDRQMEIVYRRRGKAETVTHVINPLGLVQRGPVTYFVVSQSKDPFFLALHRISRAGMLETPAQRSADFDLDRLDFGFGDGTTIRLQAVVTKEVAKLLYESPLSANQKLIPLRREWTKVVATVPKNQQLEWWLLGFGAHVEVISPVKLRNQLRRTVVEMSRHYRYTTRSRRH